MAAIPDDAQRCSDSGAVDAWMWHDVQGGHTVVTMAGEFDVYSVPTWRRQTRALVDQATGDLILVDYGVTFFDSTALGTLVGLLRYTHRQGRKLRLVGFGQSPTGETSTGKTLRITGLTKVFPMYDSVAAAVAGADAEPTTPEPPSP